MFTSRTRPRALAARHIHVAACAAFAALPFLTSAANGVTLAQCQARYENCYKFCYGGSRETVIKCTDQCINNVSRCFGRASDKIPGKAKPPTKTGTVHPPVHAGGGVLQPPTNPVSLGHPSGRK